MSATWLPQRRTYHLRVFVICLLLVLLCLGGFLFGVQMEAVAPASGIIAAREQLAMRATLAGLIEPGWCEGTITDRQGALRQVRLDGRGNGLIQPQGGEPETVHDFVGEDGRRIEPKTLRFHRLQAGDELWPGQVVAAVRVDDARLRLQALEVRPADGSTPGKETNAHELAWLRHQLDQANLRVPGHGELWLALDVRVSPLQAVQAGDVVATLVPIDPHTRQPRDLIARLEVPEKHYGDVRAEQSARLYSNMFHQRLHGYAEAVIERLEPMGEAGKGDERIFHVVARIENAPFAMPIGSSVKAEIVVGRKMLARLILEH
jgi:hypothetical protein